MFGVLFGPSFQAFVWFGVLFGERCSGEQFCSGERLFGVQAERLFVLAERCSMPTLEISLYVILYT
jgi:hypothetical protein